MKTQDTPRRRTPLSRERVVHAAIALADERGAQELTMRKLAKELGVSSAPLEQQGKEAGYAKA